MREEMFESDQAWGGECLRLTSGECEPNGLLFGPMVSIVLMQMLGHHKSVEW